MPLIRRLLAVAVAGASVAAGPLAVPAVGAPLATVSRTVSAAKAKASPAWCSAVPERSVPARADHCSLRPAQSGSWFGPSPSPSTVDI
jgi:hypothetical protein